MNKSTLIKLSDTHYIVVEDSEIEEGVNQYYFDRYIKKIRSSRGAQYGETQLVITHSTQPLGVIHGENGKERITYGSNGYISLQEVEEAIYGYSLEKMAIKNAKEIQWVNSQSEYYHKIGYVKGFNAHKELVKDKLFTVEQVLSIINEIGFVKTTTDELNSKEYQPFITDENGEVWTINKQHIQNYIQSLLPRTTWEVNFDEQGKLKLA